MSSNNKERLAYFNGKIVPESVVKVPFRDRGFKYGDAVFDMTRTFNHKIFKLEDRDECINKVFGEEMKMIEAGAY